MNNILKLRGQVNHVKNNQTPGATNIPPNQSIEKSSLDKLIIDLQRVISFWEEELVRKANLNLAPLISVHCNRLLAKSNRIERLFGKDQIDCNNKLVGAKYAPVTGEYHIFTYMLSLEELKNALVMLEEAAKIMHLEFKDIVTHEQLQTSALDKYNWNKYLLTKSSFAKILKDVFYISSFKVDTCEKNLSGHAIVSIFKNNCSIKTLLQELNIKINEEENILDNYTALLDEDSFNLLKAKVPYLIAMSVTDLRALTFKQDNTPQGSFLDMPSPSCEPVIGVIDTVMDPTVYFSEWVEYHELVPGELIEPADRSHGTQVTSIIVDGEQINPRLKDGCGRFRVRHFGVCSSQQFSSFQIIKGIREIVKNNPDIHVWNLSLGSPLEIGDSYISPEAAILDELQVENNVVFVVAGTNDKNDSHKLKIGAPADSLNSIVVNSVDISTLAPAEYGRKGPVLRYFNKPDLSYYGGTKSCPLRTCSNYGESLVMGTSFAAPWITRKLAYMIEILKLPINSAKALLIHSALDWDRPYVFDDFIGHGIVPQNINDIVQSNNDEIRFIIEDVASEYNNLTTKIPVPIINNEHPYVAKVTLCYTPKCSRNNGVDYTNTELALQFGPAVAKNNSIKLKPIADTTTNECVTESQARKKLEKWNNVKCLVKCLRTATGRIRRPIKKAGEGLWGLKVVRNERLSMGSKEPIKFSAVVTLKALDKQNRLSDFINLCEYYAWNVEQVDVEVHQDLYVREDEDIIFE